MSQLEEFGYLGDAARQVADLHTDTEIEAFLNQLTPEQRAEFARLYDLIESRGDATRLSEWIHYCFEKRSEVSYKEFWFSRAVLSLLNRFTDLADKGVAPFSSRRVRFIDKAVPAPDWSALPSNLAYLIAPAESFGIFSSEGEMLAFLKRATDNDMEILARTAEKIRLADHFREVNDWISAHPFQQHSASWMLYCLLGLLDHADLLLVNSK